MLKLSQSDRLLAGFLQIVSCITAWLWEYGYYIYLFRELKAKIVDELPNAEAHLVTEYNNKVNKSGQIKKAYVKFYKKLFQIEDIEDGE